MLIQTMLPIEDSSQVGNARRAVNELAANLGFDADDAGRAALVVTEAATNLIKHAKQGRVLLRPLDEQHQRAGLEILALDRGPGIENVAASLRDGHSTAGSPGTGLGALSRLADSFEIYSQRERGTALRIELWPRQRIPPASQSFEIGAVCIAKAGEPLPGDDWFSVQAGRFLNVLVADGLGHGVDAARAARAATKVLRDHPTAEPHSLLEQCHSALTATRGAAVAVTRLEADTAVGRFAGVGNVSARVDTGENSRSLVSHNGTVGHNVRRIQEFSFPWPMGGLLILHSDGLTSHWDLGAYPGLSTKHAGLIAGVLYRDFERGRDDVTVIVIKNRH